MGRVGKKKNPPEMKGKNMDISQTLFRVLVAFTTPFIIYCGANKAAECAASIPLFLNSDLLFRGHISYCSSKIQT